MKISLALGGGGAKGLAHIEFLKVFDELGIKPKTICGTSMGAVIGALYASGKTAEEIEKIAKDVHKMDIFRLTDISFSKKGIVKGNRIVKWLEKEIGISNFNDLEIPLRIVATDFYNGKQVIFKKGNLIDAIRASIAIPGIFEPKIIKGRAFVDGGIFNQVPFENLKHYRIAIDVTNRISPPKIPNLYENVMNCFYMMSNEMNKNKKDSADLLIQPYLPHVGLLDFHKYPAVERAVADDVKKFRKKLKKLMD